MLSPRRILTCLIIMAFFLALPQSNYGWNDTGHMMVARIAWDNLSPAARQQMVALVMQAPANSCLRELFPQDNRPLAERERQFFIAAATWPDVIRPRDNDTRPCRLLHHREWHFVDHFWSGTSGSPNDPPHDVNIAIAQINAAERLQLFRNQVGSTVVPVSERAMLLAWILHLVGDIHQP